MVAVVMVGPIAADASTELLARVELTPGLVFEGVVAQPSLDQVHQGLRQGNDVEERN